MGKYTTSNGSIAVKNGDLVGDSSSEGPSENGTIKCVDFKFLCFKFTINRETLPLKLTLFLYYGAMAAILPYLTIHMLAIGISIGETAIIYGVLPFTSFIGPPLMGFLADKLGQYKTVLIVSTCANAFFHTMLLAVPYYSETPLYADVQLKWSTGLNQFHLTPANPAHCEVFMRNFQAVDRRNLTTVISSCSEISYYEQPEGFVDGLSWDATTIKGVDGGSLRKEQRRYEGKELCGKDTSGDNEHVLLDLLCNLSDFADSENTTESGTPSTRFLFELEPPASCSAPLLAHFPSFKTTPNVTSFSCHTNVAIDTGAKVIHGNNALTFWLYFFIRIIATIFMSACFTLLDATTLAIVKRQTKAEYGAERIWTVLGTAAVSPIAGILVDWFSRGKPETDYSAAFYVSNVLFCLNIVSYFIIRLDVEKPEKNVIKDAKKLFRYPEVVVFLVMIFVLGNMWGFVESYLFVFLKDDLDAPNYLLGLTLTTGSLTGIPFLYWADKIVKKLGRVNVIAIAFIVYFVRFAGYAYLQNPWWCFPFEAMEAFTYHLMWTAAATYCSILAPKGLLATLTGIMGALHYSLGKGFGSFIGGYVIELVKVRQAFWDFGLASGIFGIIYFIMNYFWLKGLIKRRNLKTAVNELANRSEKGTDSKGAIPSSIDDDKTEDDDDEDEEATEAMLQLPPQ